MSVDRSAPQARLLAAVEAIAVSRQEGAFLVLEAERGSLACLRRSGASDEELDAILSRAAQVALGRLPGATCARTSWNRHELALLGSRDHLAAAATSLLTELLAHPGCGRLGWRAVLTRILPGEALRTLHCDAGYALETITSSAVVWVEPYPGDDWKQSQRYPTTAVVWQDSGR
jgi:hypothetical protein